MSTFTYLSLAKCEFPYEAQTEDELTVEEDQIVWVLEDDDPEWFKVKIRTEADNPGIGLVPASYLTTPTLLRSTVALYDYVPARTDAGEMENEEELEMAEGEKLNVWEDEGDWVLVGKVDGKGAGFVPASYIEGGENAVAEAEEDEVEEAPPAPTAYVDPSERVATSKAVSKGGEVKTWSVTEIDKKKKKKKGTLGVGNGAVFFASESDKTPVQQYPLSSLTDLSSEKSKHLHLTFPTSGELHFVINTKEAFDEITAMIEEGRSPSSPASSTPSAIPPPPPAPPAPVAPQAPPAPPPPPVAAAYVPPPPPIRSAAPAPPPPPPAPVAQVEEDGSNGDAEALYDFDPQGDDELAVKEGDRLVFIHDGSDDPEWVKVRKVGSTEEGVVPASYVQLDGAAEEEGETAEEREAREAEEAASAADAAALAAQLKADAKAAADREAKVKADREAKEKQKRELQATEAARRKRLESQPTAAPIPIPQPGEEDDAPPKVGARPTRSEVAGSSRGTNGRDRGSKQAVSKPQMHKVRTWKDRTGQFKVEAEFLGLNGNKIRLHKLNGVIIEVPVEKMSAEDTAYLKRAAARVASQEGGSSRHTSEDSRSKRSDSADVGKQTSRPVAKKKQTDWFEFFLNAGVDMDDCTRYANNFEREKVDEGLLSEMEGANLRSLGLREGDIIRVLKHIKEKFGPPPTPEKTDREAQIAADALMARSLQGPTPPPPNLFSGPDGRLRGRRQTTSRAAPASVDSAALAAAGSELSKHRGTPPVRVESPSATTSSSLDPSRRSSSTKPIVGGFDDDAWTVKTPSKPTTPTPPAAVAPPPAPAAPTPPPAPPAPTPIQPASVPQRPESANASTLTYNDGLLANLGIGVRPPSAPVAQTQPTGGSFTSVSSGGSFTANGPRAPIAPIAANQGLLAPLIPTQTGFVNRPQFSQAPLMPAMTGFMPMGQQPLSQSFTGMPMQAQSPFGGMTAPMQMQPTGAPSFMQPQATGMFSQPQATGFQQPMFQQPQQTGFQQPQPTGFQQQPQSSNSTFNPAPARFNSPVQFNPTPPPPSASSNSTAASNSSTAQFQPTNIFASMKDGSFAKGSSQLGPQDSNKYDALRPQPTGMPFGQGLQPQQTGFMQPQQTGFMQPQMTGFPGQQQQQQPMYPQQTGMFPQQNGFGRQF